ncbi:MAG: hypothetical protein FWB96_08220 [Defluviitaleaceae bacterium]|nr:hypothetical protein [Defluviitaleaceae bacterium]MCL2224936.1 hypothetical protein [Defluviitaleaceae bacterium]MCL2262502.1 hypothetical protein [Defluviitaleaceae bacterium]
MESSKRDIVYELEGQLFTWDKIKAEYDLSTMKRRGHPLREKVLRGEITLINPLEIPDREAKLAALPPDERVFVTDFLKSLQNERESITI